MVAGWIVYTHQAARLDLSNDDDSYTAGKSIGMVPASEEIYAEGVGFVDSTIFYQAVVRPDEVAWLAQPPKSLRSQLQTMLLCGGASRSGGMDLVQT
jgi:hypothetical protein